MLKLGMINTGIVVGAHDLDAIICNVLAFELLFRVAKGILGAFIQLRFFVIPFTNEKAKAKIYEEGPSYVVSFLHACGICWIVMPGLIPLLFSTPHVQYEAGDVHGLGFAEANQIFISYLIHDLIHVLGSNVKAVDVILHHALFIACSCVAGYYERFYFAFVCLMTGELSSPFLNLRWFVLQTGRGGTRAMTYLNYMFAVTFFFARVVVYGGLLIHMFVHRKIIANVCFNFQGLWFVLACIGSGYVLNIVWFRKILRMATKKRTIGKKQ